MTVEYVGAGAIGAGTAGTASIAWPSGHQAGDIGILLFTALDAAVIPPGWTPVGAGGKRYVYMSPQDTVLCWKLATSASMPAVTVGPGTSANVHGIIFAFRGCDTSNPVLHCQGSIPPMPMPPTRTTDSTSDLYVGLASVKVDSVASQWGVFASNKLTGISKQYDAGSTVGVGRNFLCVTGRPVARQWVDNVTTGTVPTTAGGDFLFSLCLTALAKPGLSIQPVGVADSSTATSIPVTFTANAGDPIIISLAVYASASRTFTPPSGVTPVGLAKTGAFKYSSNNYVGTSQLFSLTAAGGQQTVTFSVSAAPTGGHIEAYRVSGVKNWSIAASESVSGTSGSATFSAMSAGLAALCIQGIFNSNGNIPSGQDTRPNWIYGAGWSWSYTSMFEINYWLPANDAESAVIGWADAATSTTGWLAQQVMIGGELDTGGGGGGAGGGLFWGNNF